MSRTSDLVRLAHRAPLRPVVALIVSPYQVALPRRGLDLVARGAMGRTRAEVRPVTTEHNGHRVTGEWVETRVSTPGSAMLYLHGSGYCLLSPRTYRSFVAQLSARTDRPAFSLAYRMAPRHRFPAAADDALAAYRWLLAQGFTDIAVSGDSAGGHLALGLCLDLAALGLPAPSSVSLFAPLVDPAFGVAATRDRVTPDSLASARTAARIVGWYFRGADATDHRVNPLAARLSSLPPLLLQAGGAEMLGADAAALAAAVRAQRGLVEHVEYAGLGHGFYLAFRFLPEAVEALDVAAEFVRRHQAAPAQVRGA